MHQILSFIRNHRGPWLYMFWRRFYIWDKSILCWASSQFQIQYKDKSGLHFSIAVNIRTISIFSICLWKQQNWQFNSGTQNVTKIRTTKPKSLQKVFTHTNAKNATANGWTYWQARQLDGWYLCFVQLICHLPGWKWSCTVAYIDSQIWGYFWARLSDWYIQGVPKKCTNRTKS